MWKYFTASRAKAVFEKGYEANWTEEIFTIATRILRDL